MAKLSIDQKKEIYEQRLLGRSAREIARVFGVTDATVHRIFNIVKHNGLEALEKKYGSYSTAFKESAINRVLINGESQNAVALDLNITPCLLNTWIKKFKVDGSQIIEGKKGRPSMKNLKNLDEIVKSPVKNRKYLDELFGDKTTFTKEDLDAIKSKLEDLMLEHEIVKKLLALGSTYQNLISNIETSIRVEIADELRDDYPAMKIYDKLNISKQVVSAHKKRSLEEHKYAKLTENIKEIFDEREAEYGARRIVIELIKKFNKLKAQGEDVNPEDYFSTRFIVNKIMIKEDLNAKRSKKKNKYSSYKKNLPDIDKDLIQRKFHSDTPNRKWYTDITEFAVRDKKLYLSLIIDGHNGFLVSWKMGVSPTVKLVLDTYKDAFKMNDIKPGELISHSDQGMHYKHPSFVKLMEDNGVIQSFSPKGHSPSNGFIEGTFGLIKVESFYGKENTFKSVEDLKEYLERVLVRFNTDRVRTKLGTKTLLEAREERLQELAKQKESFSPKSFNFDDKILYTIKNDDSDNMIYI